MHAIFATFLQSQAETNTVGIWTLIMLGIQMVWILNVGLIFNSYHDIRWLITWTFENWNTICLVLVWIQILGVLYSDPQLKQ